MKRPFDARLRVLLVAILMVGCSPSQVGVSRHEQYEEVDSRRQSLKKLALEIVRSMGKENWIEIRDKALPVVLSCDGTSHGSFYFDMSRPTVRGADPYAERDARDQALDAASNVMLANNLTLERFDANGEVRINGTGADAFVSIVFHDSGTGNMSIYSTCSDSWPGINLTTDDIRERDNERIK